MRSLIISVIILCFTLIGVCVNAFTVDKKLNELLGTLDSIYNINDENTGEQIDELIKMWENAEAQLSLTTNRKELGEVEHKLTDLTIAFYEKDDHELALARSSIADLITEIKLAQIFDIKTIL